MSGALILGIAGAGGHGVVLAGEVLMKAAACLGYHAMLTKSFGSQIRGVTFCEPEAQLRAHKTSMQSLESIGHDASDRARAMALAQDYGSKLYTGVLFQEPKPRPSFEELARERRRELGVEPARRARVLDAFRIEDDADRQ